MELMVERCAGVDIGKDEVVACVRIPAPSGKGRRKETRLFSSFTSQLDAMADWFVAEGVIEVVMEATGSYWKPVWYVLEERGFDLKLVNARHVKILPGRKTDVADAEWLAELLEHGLLRGSFVPPVAIRGLRDLTRYHKRMIQAHTSECQRIQKRLKDAGIKLDAVASDVLGVSSRLMLQALVAGERDPGVLADLAKGALRKKIPELREALRGRFRDHHALLIRLCLDHTTHLETAIGELDERVDTVIAPFARPATISTPSPGFEHPPVVTVPRSIPTATSSMSASVSIATPHSPNLALAHWIVGVAPHQRRQVERRGQSVAARGENLVESLIGVHGRSEAGEHAIVHNFDRYIDAYGAPGVNGYWPGNSPSSGPYTGPTGRPDIVPNTASRIADCSNARAHS